MTARTTTILVAPAATTSPRFAASMPPIANQGTGGASAATAWSREVPTADRPGLVAVG